MKAKLSNRHWRLLVEHSGISASVVAERGYRTIRDLDELRPYGFRPRAHWRGHERGLLVPIYLPAGAPSGSVAPVVFRPDLPLVDQTSGRLVKYAVPRGARNYIDVHPSMRARLQDPDVGVLITEGHKKADAAASRGLVCLALSGVDNFVYRPRDERGRPSGERSRPCDEWDSIPTEGRSFTIVYDSDLASNVKVHGARGRLTRFLRSRGARVWWADLPDGQGGAKNGLDDYFLAGHGPADLRGLARPAPRGPQGGDGHRHAG